MNSLANNSNSKISFSKQSNSVFNNFYLIFNNLNLLFMFTSYLLPGSFISERRVGKPITSPIQSCFIRCPYMLYHNSGLNVTRLTYVASEGPTTTLLMGQESNPSPLQWQAHYNQGFNGGYTQSLNLLAFFYLKLNLMHSI